MNQGIDWSRFTDKRVALLGAGKENISLIPWLTKAKAKVTLCEKTLDDSLRGKLQQYPGVTFKLGDEHLSNLNTFDYVFRSPGFPLELVEHSLNDSIKTIKTSAMALFIEGYRNQIIGVTGTKGKGTTTTMIGSILSAAGIETIVAGNIGEVIYDRIKEITPETKIILELSSFQLMDVTTSPAIAVLVPISPDHLEPLSEKSPNYHHSLDEYLEAKSTLVRFQKETDAVVYPVESQLAEKVAIKSAAKKFPVGKNQPVFVDDSGVLNLGTKKIDLNEVGVRGDHFRLDAALAAVTGRIAGADHQAVIAGLQNFKPLPHRMEEVGTKNGIQFVNDSYATTPESAMAALSAFDTPVILIAGGSRKGADFNEFAQFVTNRQTKAVVLLGEEAGNIGSALHTSGYSGNIVASQSLVDAVEKAVSLADIGDTVLLSPACASKDMFTDAADRGNQFKSVVSQLPNE